MEKVYKYASITNNNEIISQISQYENEISEKYGNNVILIAYSKEEADM